MIQVAGVEKLLQQVNVNKYSGPDNIPKRVLQELAPDLAPMLTSLFTQSITTWELPEDWRDANISPIFKKGDRHIAANYHDYRSVSLTCVCCKLLEHIICHNVRDHLDKHDMLMPLQQGFRQGHSCETQLLVTLHDLMLLFDHKFQVYVAILDFSKAFDTVPHDKLMDKLEHYGITSNGSIHQWIANFLKQRKQCIVVEGIKSNSVHVESGVPQGTVLGPPLFYSTSTTCPGVSTLRYVSSQMTASCIAQYVVKRNITSSKLINSLCDWAKTWGMSFNTSKCHIMSITNRRVTSIHLYSMLGHVLFKVDNIRYLGITIASNLC